MKFLRKLILPLTALGAACFVFGFVAMYSGCTSNEAQTAVATEGVAIPSVNAAMTTWASIVNSGGATAAQVATVSNAYIAYYNAQLAASNAAQIYVATPSTNLVGVLANLEATALASQSNLSAVISAFTNKP